MSLPETTLLTITCIGFAYASIKLNLLTIGGVIASILTGLTLLYCGGISVLIPLIFFFLSGSLLSRILPPRHQSDNKSGKARDAVQVFANGGVYTTIALIHYFYPHPSLPVLMAITLSTATSDTWASDIGLGIPSATYNISNFRLISPGVSGGISITGTLGGLAGALSIALLYYYIINQNLLHTIYITAAGFTGMITDSLLGAKLQAKYYQPQTGHWSDNSNPHYQHQSGFSTITNDHINLISQIILCTVATLPLLIAKSLE
ncbi:MAG: DUF92 domain-containing protein [Bacteroidia bacterium]|nr:DUF92 domain-containing protein [Bacteroidia bacterium]